MLHLISDLYENMENYKVLPSIDIGYLRNTLPSFPPQDPENFQNILQDTKNFIFTSITKWQHPNFFAYYPSCTSHATVIADMFASTFNSPAFTWVASPAQTELENITCDWVAQMLNLPEAYQLKNEGGGTIAVSVSDAFHLVVHAAKQRKIQQNNIPNDSPQIFQFVAYYFEHSFPTCEKALKLKDIVHTRCIECIYDSQRKNFYPNMEQFTQTLQQDIQNGLIPFLCFASYGTTSTCSIDPLEEIITICQQYKMWINLDAAYAGLTWVCPDLQMQKHTHLLSNIDSLEINFSKAGFLGMVGCLFYLKDKKQFCQAFNKDRSFEICKNKFSGLYNVTDYKDWMVGFGRRWNSLKLYYNIRAFGVKGYQEHIRKQIKLCEIFESYLKESNKFEILTGPYLGLVTFCLKCWKENQNQNEINKKLKEILDKNNERGYITPSSIQGKYFLRLVVCNPSTFEENIQNFWIYLNECVDLLIKEEEEK